MISAIKGADGRPGFPGEKGMIGMAGLPGPSAYIIARHSQSNRRPICPRGGVKLWDGFSLLKTDYSNAANTMDLGD